MVNIIKEEISLEESLKKKIEFICVCLTSHEHFLVVKTIVLSSDFNKNR